MGRLLAVDIGNTNIHNGIFKGRVLERSFIIPTCSNRPCGSYVKKLRSVRDEIKGAIIVSVVPEALKEVEETLKDAVRGKILVVGRDVSSGVKNRYRKPKQVGQDRLVNARAAYELHGGPSIVVDFGTAITIDIVNKNKEYLGGVIAPGVEISLSALSEQAALLPKVSLERPKALLGRETVESMISGAIYGFSSLCDGMIQRFKKEYIGDAKVIATGGLSSLIGPYCKTVDKIDPGLTLKGLSIIWEGCNV
jgi:type III pantothenate kinase